MEHTLFVKGNVHNNVRPEIHPDVFNFSYYSLTPITYRLIKGNSAINVEPFPTPSDSAQTLPLCASTISLAK